MARMTLEEALAWAEAHPEGLEYEIGQLPVAIIHAERDPTLMDHDDFVGNVMIDQVEDAKAQWEADEFDIAETGRPTCDCEAGEPCCMKGLKIGCEHSADRLVLPLTGDISEAKIVLIADKGAGNGHDTVKFTPTVEPIEDCTQPNKLPILKVRGAVTGDYEMSGPVDVVMNYPQSLLSNAASNTARFGFAMYDILFGDIEDIGQDIRLNIESCYGTTVFNSEALIFPKMEVTATAFSWEYKVALFSNLNFLATSKFAGGLEIKYASTTTTIEASSEDKPENATQQDADKASPFIKAVSDRLKSMTSAGGETDNRGRTSSSIEIDHKTELGNSVFKLSEHPTDPTKVGIDATIEFGCAPFIGLKVTLDVIDAALTAAQGAAPQIARAIQKVKDGRERLATDGFMGIVAHAGITLSADAEFGGKMTLIHPVGATAWESQSEISGSIEFELAAILEVEGKTVLVEGAIAAEGSAKSKFEGKVKGLTTAEQAEAQNKGKKINFKVGWDGLKLKYGGTYSGTAFGIFSTEDDIEGEFVVFGESDFFNRNY